MAEIIAEPTALSKVIALKFKINDVDVPKTTQLPTNKQFNTTDTDAWFTFELDGLATTNGTYNLTLINLDDKSIFHHADVLFAALPFHYKLNSSEDVTLNEIRHAGRWLGQLVVTLSNGDTTARQFGFNIAGHILDGQDAQVILLSDYQALINTINLAKDDLAQYNIDFAALIADVTTAENARGTAYNQLLADQQANIEAFDVALDEGIVAANLATKLQDFETTNNSRLLSAEQQLAEKRNKFEAIMMEDLHTEVKSAMTGGSVAVVGVNSTGTENIKNKAVTGVKVDFLSQTKNLLNPYTTVIGKKLSYDGALYDDPLYQTSDFVEVKNGVTYTISKYSYYINMYTSENVFLNVLSSGTKTIPFTFIAPQDGYIRVTYLTIHSLSVTVGDDISLDPYGFRPNENMFNLNDAIKKTHIKNNVVSTQKTDFIIHSQNLFNKYDLEIIQGKYISSTGVLTDNPPTFVSGKIPLVPGEKYITAFFSNLNDANCGAYYNERDERIDTVTGVTTGSYRVITVPKNEMISYMKINHRLSEKEVLMIVKGEIYPSQYVSFYKRLDKTFVVSDDLLSDNIKSTTQSIVFNADRSVQKIQHKDSFGGIVRDDVFTYTTNQITEVRTLSNGQTVTYKYHLDTLETEII